MNYLIFDIECSDGKHVCEFGYVKFDESFNILKRECITINPEKRFKLSGRKEDSDIKLAFTKEQYASSPTFPALYDKIKGIIEEEGITIIGFSMHNDDGFLLTACARYNLPPIKFKFFDLQKMYKAYSNSKNVTSIKKLVELLELRDITLHKSDDDSFATMKILQAIAKKENLSILDTLSLLQKKMNSFSMEQSQEKTATLIDKVKAGKASAQKEYLTKFVKKLKVSHKAKASIVKNKRVSISYVLQKEQFNLFLALIKKLYAFGARFTTNSTKCDLYITYLGACQYDSRQQKAEEVNGILKNVTFISLEEFLSEFNLTKEQLAKINYIGKNYI